jgi:alpha-L-rhamnosidase
VSAAAAPLQRSLTGSLVASKLRCESRENPLGIQTDSPTLSWIATPRNATLRGLSLTGYRVIVASSLTKLTRDQGDLWDTGKLSAKNVLQSRYAGKPLRAASSYWWKVQIWDQSDAASSWSEAATFTMGLQPNDWTAHWITSDAQVLGKDPQQDAAAVPVFDIHFRHPG